MDYTLYGFPGTRTNRVQWLLEELGLPYDYRRLDVPGGEHKSPAHLARHPHGAVPVLDHGELRLLESSAMVLHLADAAGRLAPPVGTPERARYYQLVVYAAATLDPPAVDLYFHAFLLPEGRRDPEKAERARSGLEPALGFLAEQLGNGPYLLGADFGAADVAIGYPLYLVHTAGGLENRPALADYVGRLSARPAFQKVFGGG